MEELDLKELFNIFWERKLEIVVILLISIVIGAVYSYFIVEPKYTSYTTLLLTQINSENSESITQTDLSLNSKLVSTYSELIKSNAVLREVIDSLNIHNLDEETLKNNIKLSDKIADIYKLNTVYVVDKAEASQEPSNINHTKDIVIFMFVGIVIACGYVLLVNMIDNTVKTETDIEKITGLKVLASIPNYDTEAKGGKRK